MEQHGLLGKIVSVLQGDARVRAAWLAGSRARGTGDQYSDTDIWARDGCAGPHGGAGGPAGARPPG